MNGGASARPLVDEAVQCYLDVLYEERDPVILEMHEYAREHNVPIVGPQVGRAIEVLARIHKAKKVMELGSAFGYSALYFARAVSDDGVVHCVDTDPKNEELARGFLSRLGLWSRIRYHVGDALELLPGLDMTFDTIFVDIDKEYYPEAFSLVRKRLRPGGLLITDNMLWYGRVTEPNPDEPTRGVLEYTRKLFQDPDFINLVLPVRDGLGVSLRVR